MFGLGASIQSKGKELIESGYRGSTSNVLTYRGWRLSASVEAGGNVAGTAVWIRNGCMGR
jgi:hypothetical protein